MITLKGVGPGSRQKLARLKIIESRDLLYHFPHRYLDFSHHLPINKATPNQNITVSGKLTSLKNIYTKTGKNIQIGTLADETGSLNLMWFSQPYLIKNYFIGATYLFAGTIVLVNNHPTLIHPYSGQGSAGKIIGIYPATAGLTSAWFRRLFQNHLISLLSTQTETLPLETQNKFKLLPLNQALNYIHQPPNLTLLKQARSRLSLDEIISLEAQSYLLKKKGQDLSPAKIFKESPLINKKIDKLISSLPFTLTPSQLQAWQEIKADLLSLNPANRLLLGDVGSGKTIIALLACYLAHLNHATSLIIAPTTILCHQHFNNLQKLFSNLPFSLITAKTVKNHLPLQGSIIIATHTAIHRSKILSSSLGLVIFDEQHKFGVDQRQAFSTSSPPHCLTMSATPIPRTVSLTLLSHLPVSRLEPRENSHPQKTFLVPSSKQIDCYRWMEKTINSTHQQAFIVCPFIETSPDLLGVKSAVDEFKRLQQDIFPNLKLGLLHSQLKTKDKEELMAKFVKNEINILVTTPIIEVGIDIPNANIIVIQSAERFGLAQLHQLRGRVGRGENPGFCYLFASSTSPKSRQRLSFFSSHHSGNQIAEYDLKTRGPGEVFSSLQHGFPNLKLANIEDLALLSLAKDVFQHLLINHNSLVTDHSSLITNLPHSQHYTTTN
ncbi:MAG: ATP-dependent DNA helicase RecG [Candidatus Shapirobacteria bacterium]